MSIVEKVKELSIEVKDKKTYTELEEALKIYHEMIQSGQLKPRENQIQRIYTPLLFKSNC